MLTSSMTPTEAESRWHFLSSVVVFVGCLLTPPWAVVLGNIVWERTSCDLEEVGRHKPLKATGLVTFPLILAVASAGTNLSKRCHLFYLGLRRSRG